MWREFESPFPDQIKMLAFKSSGNLEPLVEFSYSLQKCSCIADLVSSLGSMKPVMNIYFEADRSEIEEILENNKDKFESGDEMYEDMKNAYEKLIESFRDDEETIRVIIKYPKYIEQ